MSAKEETSIVRDCLEWLLKNGGRGYHVNGSSLQPTGEPDIDGYISSLVLSRYLHLKIEIKTPTGSPSPKQLLRLAEYKTAGYVTGIATSLEEFIRIIRNYETNYTEFY